MADADLRVILNRAARNPPKRGAAAVCRNLLLDEYMDADTANALKAKFANATNPQQRPTIFRPAADDGAAPAPPDAPAVVDVLDADDMDVDPPSHQAGPGL